MPNRHLLCILSPSLSLLRLLLLLLLLSFSGSFHGVHSAFLSDCDPVSSSSQCGNIPIKYPFSKISDAPVRCGYLGLSLNCPPGSPHPILSLPDDTFFVADINYDEKTLTLVNIHVADQKCPRARHNPTIGSLPLDYNPADVNLTFFFNCSAPPGGPILPNGAIDCLRFMDKQSYVSVNMSQEAATVFDAVSHCEETVVAAMKGTELTAENVVEKFAGAIGGGFVLDWETAKECDKCERSGGRCAYNQNGQFLCYCDGGSIHTDRSLCKGKQKPGLKIAIAAASGAGLGITLISMLSFRKKPMIRIIIASINRRSKHFDAEMKIEGLVSSRRYTYKNIKRMTNSFEEKLGQGGYGCVYKGKLRNGQLVAVKVLKKLKGDAEEFFNEVGSISRTSHVNVVNLLGFCFEGSKRALVYEFMPNGSLEKFIFSRSNTLEVDQLLSWDTLYQISLGIAHGLEYLHRGCNTRILHFDIKPHNILLDENYCPKISDFGLAKICPREESIVSMLDARGTPGYIAPELIIRNIGRVSHKSDVYSYGMMVLEMVGKRKNIEVIVDHTSKIYFPHWVHQRLELQEELGLPGITNEEDEGIAKKMILISLWCIQIDPRARPSMTKVVEMLKGSVDALQVPPKPTFSSPSRSPVASLGEMSFLQKNDDLS